MSRKGIVSTVASLLIVTAGSAIAQKPTEQVAKGPTPKATNATSTKATPIAMVDLNSASKQALMALPGITETSAQKIIENRPYKSKGDLTQKKVLSADAYAKIEARIVARTSTRVSPGTGEKRAASSKGASEVQKKQ